MIVKTHPEKPHMLPVPGWYIGGDMSFAPPPGDTVHGALDAWDPFTGKKKWSVRDEYPRISSVLSTRGGVVFSGDMKGFIYAYDGANGKQLWQFNMGSACRGGIVTYMVDGEQYVLVPSGIGGGVPAVVSAIYPEISEFPTGSSLFAFKLSK